MSGRRSQLVNRSKLLLMGCALHVQLVSPFGVRVIANFGPLSRVPANCLMIELHEGGSPHAPLGELHIARRSRVGRAPATGPPQTRTVPVTPRPRPGPGADHESPLCSGPQAGAGPGLPNAGPRRTLEGARARRMPQGRRLSLRLSQSLRLLLPPPVPVTRPARPRGPALTNRKCRPPLTPSRHRKRPRLLVLVTSGPSLSSFVSPFVGSKQVGPVYDAQVWWRLRRRVERVPTI